MKKISFLFTIVFFVLQLFLIFSVYAEKTGSIVNDYPTTPEGVINAYCTEDFNGVGLGPDFLRNSNLLRYTISKKAPVTTMLVTNFRIIKISERKDKAEFRVEYDTAGSIFPAHTGYLMSDTNRIGEAFIFKLIKSNNVWKIEKPQAPHVSVNTVIRRLEEELVSERDPKKMKNKQEVLGYLKSESLSK